MLRQKPKRSSGKLLESVASAGLRHTSAEDLAELAKQLWYSPNDLMPELKREVSSKLRQVDQKKRALYLVDRLRRYPCVSEDKAAHLKEFVSSWAFLKPATPSKRASQLVASHRLDKLAFEWGLEEDVTTQMKEVLQYQTRHFAAKQGVRTGYNEEQATSPDEWEQTSPSMAR